MKMKVYKFINNILKIHILTHLQPRLFIYSIITIMLHVLDIIILQILSTTIIKNNIWALEKNIF